MRQIKIEYAFKGVEKDYFAVADIPETVSDKEAEEGMQSMREFIQKAWQDGMRGHIEVGNDSCLIRIEELRSFTINMVK